MMLSAETIQFLSDLKANNNRDWFTAQKKHYERALKNPAALFADQLCRGLDAATARPHQPKIFRINRDVRFSADKSPYNAHLHISISMMDAPADAPVWMFGLSPDYLSYGVGTFAFSPQGLQQWRKGLDGPWGAEAPALLDSLMPLGIRLGDAALKRVPAPFPADHPRADLLRHKGFTVWRDADDRSEAFGANGADTAVQKLLSLRPAFEWLLRL